MSTTSSHRRPGRGAFAALVATTALTLAGCGDNPEQPTTGSDAPDIRGAEDLEDPYDGPYTADFHADVEAYADQEVTLEAAVDQVLSPTSFTITGPDGEDVEPILVVSRAEVPDLRAGEAVVVAATPRDEFEAAAVEAELDVDLPEGAYEDWEGDPYLDASAVSASATAD